jgi:hypothetical protein
MALHRNLTGAALHEPKGVESASADTVYVADGSGSGSWVKVGSGALDSSSVKNLNKEQLAGTFFDIGTSGSQYVGILKACTVSKILVTLQGATATASTILTFRNAAGSSMGTITITSGAAAGDTFTLTPLSNNTFVADTRMQIDTDGGTSTTPNAHFNLELTWT